QPLAIGASVDEHLVGLDRRSLNRARVADGCTQIVARQVARDLLKRAEEKRPVPLDRAPNGAAELFAVKILERFAVGGVGGQAFQALKMKQATVQFVATRLGDDIDDPASRSSELRRSACANAVEFL